MSTCILASGDYSYNDEMLQKYAPWVYAHKDNYLFSHEGMDCKGNHASTGDGQKLGISVGGHLDIAPSRPHASTLPSIPLYSRSHHTKGA